MVSMSHGGMETTKELLGAAFATGRALAPFTAMTVEPRRPVSGKDVVVALGLGVAVAGLAGIAAGAAFGTGVVAAALQQSRRRALDSITRDAEGRLHKYDAVLAAVRKGVSR